MPAGASGRTQVLLEVSDAQEILENNFDFVLGELLDGGASSVLLLPSTSSSSKTSRHKCHLCLQQDFSSAMDYRLHLKQHGHQKSSLPCPSCGAHAPTTTKLWQHIAKTHLAGSQKTDLACTLCINKTFRHALNFHLHMLIHMGEQPEACRYCRKSFRTKPSLRKHEMIHTGLKPFACTSAQCPMVFKTRDELKQHAHSHSSLKQFQCGFCGGQFKYSASLKRHEKKGRCRIGKHWCPDKKKSYKSRRTAAATVASSTCSSVSSSSSDVSCPEEEQEAAVSEDYGGAMYGDVFFGYGSQDHRPSSYSSSLEQIFSF